MDRAVVGTAIGSRRRHGLLRSAVVASGATIAAVGVVLAVLALSLVDQRASNRRVRRSEQVLRDALSGERSVVDIETALRGYVITRDRSFLGPYRAGIPAAMRRTARLVARTAGDGSEQAIARRIQREVASYISGYARPLAGL